MTVTNEGDALYAIAIPIIYQMSVSLPALVAETDGLACAIDGRDITCLGDEIDIAKGGEFTVPLKIGLPSGMQSRVFEGCARFPDLGQLRSGELTPDGIRLLQLALIRNGMDLDSVDGDFGPATQNAVDVFSEALGLPTQKGVSPEIIEALFPAPLFAKAPEGASPEICVKTPVETIPRTAETQLGTIRAAGDQQTTSQDRRGALVKRFAIDFLTSQLRGKKKPTARPEQASERGREPSEAETRVPSGGEMMEIAPPENTFQFR